MRISTVREFRDNATVLLRSKDPILVTRRGKLAGIDFEVAGVEWYTTADVLTRLRS